MKLVEGKLDVYPGLELYLFEDTTGGEKILKDKLFFALQPTGQQDFYLSCF